MIDEFLPRIECFLQSDTEQRMAERIRIDQCILDLPAKDSHSAIGPGWCVAR